MKKLNENYGDNCFDVSSISYNTSNQIFTNQIATYYFDNNTDHSSSSNINMMLSLQSPARCREHNMRSKDNYETFTTQINLKEKQFDDKIMKVKKDELYLLMGNINHSYTEDSSCVSKIIDESNEYLSNPLSNSLPNPLPISSSISLLSLLDTDMSYTQSEDNDLTIGK